MSVDPPFESFLLTPTWRQDRIVLVRGTEAIRLSRKGTHDVLPAYRAITWIERLQQRDAGALRRYLASAKLSGIPLTRLDDRELLVLLRCHLAAGAVAVVRLLHDGDAGDNDTEKKQRRLVQEIAKSFRSGLSHLGRHYRLVAGSGLSRLAARDSYQVVGRREAVMVLQALAAGAGDPRHAKLLAEAMTMLTPDWRPPLLPEGLVLLRRLIVQQAVGSELGPALTPSQIKKLGQSDWIEIEVVDEEDQPFYGGYDIQLPDGTALKSDFGPDGLWSNYAIETGECKLGLRSGALVAQPTVPAAGTSPPLASDPELPSDPVVPGTTCPDGPDCPIDPCNDCERPPNYIEMIFLDDSGHPLANRTFEVQYPDGTSERGTSGEDGVARIFNAAATGPTTVRLLS